MKIVGMTVQLEQEGDCCGGESWQYLDVEIADGGGGPYFVLKTDRWALDCDDLTRFQSKLEELLAFYKKDDDPKKEKK